MPTGFEEAGLALAIFPLLVSVIEQYRQGLGMVFTTPFCRQKCINSSNRHNQELDSVQEITSQPPPNPPGREAPISKCLLQTSRQYLSG